VQAYTLTEVMTLGIEARHVAKNGAIYCCSCGSVVRTDPRGGVSVLITNRKRLPEWPWHRVDSA